jgi:hypothetical protein
MMQRLELTKMIRYTSSALCNSMIEAWMSEELLKLEYHRYPYQVAKENSRDKKNTQVK